MKQVRFYSSFSDDFDQSADQDFKLDENYKWVRTDLRSRCLSGLIYGLAVILGGAYCKFFLHMRVKGRKKLKGLRGGFFIYGNHTQPVGDVFIPALCVLPKRIYTVVSTANYGIPVIGKILPFLGALPIVDSLHGIKELSTAIEERLKKGHPVVIYPEAHVWEYYTHIRPFPDTAFKFPVKFDAPTFAMTVTYKKSRFFKRPIMEVFLDGPFHPQGSTAKDKARNLHQKVFSAMCQRSKTSNCSYIVYKEKTQETK